MAPVRIGTRGSALALWQAKHVQAALEPVLGPIELEIIKTSGDKNQRDPLSQIGAAAGGKGLFVKEIEEALLEGRVSLAVHSSKDLPSVLPDGLVIAAFPQREDARDAIVASGGATLDSLPRGGRIGTSSLRRMAQLRARRPDLVCADLRGNVDTRLRKLDEGQYDAILLAVAGLKRLGFASRISAYVETTEMIPAVGQGALGIEMRAADPLREKVAAALDHAPTRAAVEAERAFLATLEGGCTIPVAAHARLQDGRLTLDGMIGLPDGSSIVRGSETGAPGDAAPLGASLARALLARGGERILAEVRARPGAPPDPP